MKSCKSNTGQNRFLMTGRCALAITILMAIPTVLVAQEDGMTSKIDSVILSSGGLTEIHRSASIDGAATLSIDIPLEHVDDFLKTLVIRDPAGTVGEVTLDGLSPVEETFRRLPFGPEDMGNLPGLAASLQGIEVQASSGGRTIEGAVLGVGTHNRSSDDIPRVEQILSVMTEDGDVEVLPLGADTTLTILDEDMRDKLRHAAEVSARGRRDDVRTVNIALNGEEDREIGLTYLAPAPVWKTAYRLMSGAEGTARLQAWAVVENATGEDWEGISLTLSSGAPVTLSQKLHQRYWNTRPEIPVTAGTAEPPRPDSSKAVVADSAGGAMMDQGQRQFRRSAAAAPMGQFEEMADSEIMAAPVAAGVATAAQEGLTNATYQLPSPVDLPAGQTVSMPFIDAEIPAERVSLFQPEYGDTHPIAALFLENNSGASLPPGILTVYDEADGYVGDAELTGLPAGESRMASFATDRKVEITTETDSKDTLGEIRIVDGSIRVTQISRQVTTYTIKGASDAERTVIIEHPRMDGWSFSSDALDSDTPTHHRLRATVPAGETVKIMATYEATSGSTYALVDTDEASVIYWADTATDPEIVEKLKELAALKKQAAEASEARDEVATAIERAEQNQSRIRSNLGSVPPESALGKRYLKMLEDEEGAIADLAEKQSEAEAALKDKRAQVAEFIRNM